MPPITLIQSETKFLLLIMFLERSLKVNNQKKHSNTSSFIPLTLLSFCLQLIVIFFEFRFLADVPNDQINLSDEVKERISTIYEHMKKYASDHYLTGAVSVLPVLENPEKEV